MNHNLAIITFSNNYDHQSMLYELHDQLLEEGFPIISIGIKNPKFKIKSKKSSNFFFDSPVNPGFSINLLNFFPLLRVFSLIKSNKITKIVFLSSHMWNVLLILLLRLFSKTKIIFYHSIHDYIPHKGDKNEKNVSMYSKLVSKICDFIIIYNPKIISDFSKEYNISTKKIIYLKYWRKFLSYSNYIPSNSCLFFGRMNYYKGLQYFETIVKSLPNIYFVFAGKQDKSSYKYCSKLIEYKNVILIDKYVYGSQSQSLFKNSELIILPYNSATMSGVVIDAYMNSRPVIAFAVGGIIEQIIHNETGFLIEPNNIDKFINTISKYFSYDLLSKAKFTKSSYNFGIDEYDVKLNTKIFINKIIENRYE